jgi:hypothetical protein
MPKTCRAARLILVILLVTSGTAEVRGQSNPRERVMIRGTGNNVSVERIQATSSVSSSGDVPGSGSPIAEAIRMGRTGAEDSEIISYLQAHSEALPPMVELRDVRALRDAGAGRSVMAYLESAVAVEIGPTAEPAERSEVEPRGLASDSDAPVSYGLPFAGARQLRPRHPIKTPFRVGRRLRDLPPLPLR